ncbi:MAG: rhomboid family intramembrane serine protease [Pseudomonadota bacterium]
MDLPDAPVTLALILANVGISFYALFGDQDFLEQFKFDVNALRQRGQHYRVFTSSFLHNDLFHLLFNMMALFSFGPYLEQLLGRTGFLVIYFGAILISGIVTFFVNRQDGAYSSVGASDAVSGVVFGFILFYPLESLYIFPLPVPIPAILFGGLFIIGSSFLMDRQDRRIAHESHLAGAAAGLILTIAMQPAAFSVFIAKMTGT